MSKGERKKCLLYAKSCFEDSVVLCIDFFVNKNINLLGLWLGLHGTVESKRNKKLVCMVFTEAICLETINLSACKHLTEFLAYFFDF